MRVESLTTFEGQTVCLESFPCDEVFLMLYSILPLPFKVGFVTRKGASVILLS